MCDWEQPGLMRSILKHLCIETFHTPYYQRQRIKLTFAAVTGEWQISGKTFALENDVSVYNRYGTARMGAYAILEQTLNLRTVTVYDRLRMLREQPEVL